SKVRQWLVDRNPDLMRFGRIGLSVAALVIIVTIVGIVVRPPNFGVEFTGGRVMDFSTQEQISVSDARQAVAAEGGRPGAVVLGSGAGTVAWRTGPIYDAGAQKVEDALGDAAGGAGRVSDANTGPSLGGELRNKARMAMVASLV